MNLFHPEADRLVEPETSVSLDQAIAVARASRPAVRAVSALMADGVARTDEEIASGVKRECGRPYAPDTVRHARLALSIAGLLRWTRKVRPTIYGKPSCIWQIPIQ